ncbi:MAG: FCD domain-containing protein, partial [Sneathiella sp.]
NAIAPSRSEHLLVAKRREISLQGHKDIFDAIKTGNPVAAAEAMNRHLQDIKENVFGSAAP